MTMKRKDMYYMMNSSKASIVVTFGRMPPGQMEHWRITHRTIAKKNWNDLLSDSRRLGDRVQLMDHYHLDRLNRPVEGGTFLC